MKQLIRILGMLLLPMLCLAQEKANYLSGQIKGFSSKGRVELQLELIDDDHLRSVHQVRSRFVFPLDSLGRFEFKFVPNDSLCYIALKLLSNGKQVNILTGKLWDQRFLMQKGDSLELQIDLATRKVDLTGKGAAKMECQIQLSLLGLPEQMQNRVFTLHATDFNRKLRFEMEATALLLVQKRALLNTYRTEIPKMVFNRIAMDMETRLLNEYVQFSLTQPYKIGLQSYRPAYTAFLTSKGTLLDSLLAVRPSLAGSPDYSSYVMNLETMRYYIVEKKDRPDYFNWMYEKVANGYSGQLRDRLLLELFITHIRNYRDDAIAKSQEAIALFDAKYYQNLFVQWRDKQLNGSFALPFEFYDKNGAKRSLEDYRDKFILLDFWFFGCHGCTQIPPKLALVREKLGDEYVAYLSVNVDGKRELWLKGLETGDYDLPWQEHLNVGNRNNSFLYYYNISILPRLILIGPDGKMISTYPPDPRKDDGSGIVKLIKDYRKE